MQGIDPRTSRMLSERSTIWATSPAVFIQLVTTPSFPVYKAYTYIKIQILSSLTNNLTIKFLFL